MIENNIYTLKKPIGDIKELRFKKKEDLIFKDYYGINFSENGKIDLEDIAKLISNLTNQPKKIIDNLSIEDWKAVVPIAAGFF